MAFDKLIDSTQLDGALTATADAIREKGGTTDVLPWDMQTGFAVAVAAIEAGGADLNFSVVAYTSEDALPATADENTIAVITTNEITSWIFSAEQPEAPAEGMVWFGTGESNSIEFNALKENGICVGLVKAMQYVNGAWNSVGVMVYQDNTWESTEYAIIRNGLLLAEMTVWNSISTITQNDGYVQFETGNNGVGIFTTTSPIDLTPYSTISITMSGRSYYRDSKCPVLCVGKSRPTATSAASSAITNIDRYTQLMTTTGTVSSFSGTFTLDVSACEGEYYVGFTAVGTSSEGSYTQTVTEFKIT